MLLLAMLIFVPSINFSDNNFPLSRSVISTSSYNINFIHSGITFIFFDNIFFKSHIVKFDFKINVKSLLSFFFSSLFKG